MRNVLHVGEIRRSLHLRARCTVVYLPDPQHSLIGWSIGTALSGTCQTAPHRQDSKYFQCTTLHTAHQSGHFARLDSPFLGLRKGSTDSFTATHPLWANAGLHSTTATSVPQRSLCHSEAHRAFTARLARWDEPSCFAARSFSSPNSLELVRRRCGQRCCAATPRPPCRMTCRAERHAAMRCHAMSAGIPVRCEPWLGGTSLLWAFRAVLGARRTAVPDDGVLPRAGAGQHSGESRPKCTAHICAGTAWPHPCRDRACQHPCEFRPLWARPEDRTACAAIGCGAFADRTCLGCGGTGTQRFNR